MHRIIMTRTQTPMFIILKRSIVHRLPEYLCQPPVGSLSWHQMVGEGKDVATTPGQPDLTDNSFSALTGPRPALLRPVPVALRRTRNCIFVSFSCSSHWLIMCVCVCVLVSFVGIILKWHILRYKLLALLNWIFSFVCVFFFFLFCKPNATSALENRPFRTVSNGGNNEQSVMNIDTDIKHLQGNYVFFSMQIWQSIYTFKIL